MTRNEVISKILALSRELSSWEDNDRYHVQASLMFIGSSTILGTISELSSVMSNTNSKLLEERIAAELREG